MDKLKRGGMTNSGSVLMNSLSQKHAISVKPRMLTPSEIELLRKDKQEALQRTKVLIPA